MECSKKRELDLMAAKNSKTALQTIQSRTGSGHIGGSFSNSTGYFILCYILKMNVDPMRQMILIEIDWYYLRDIAHRLCMQRWH